MCHMLTHRWFVNFRICAVWHFIPSATVENSLRGVLKVGVDRPYYVIFELQRTDYQRSASYVTLRILYTPVAGKDNFNELRTVCSFSHSLRSFLFWGKYVKDFSAMRTPQRTSY